MLTRCLPALLCHSLQRHTRTWWWGGHTERKEERRGMFATLQHFPQCRRSAKRWAHLHACPTTSVLVVSAMKKLSLANNLQSLAFKEKKSTTWKQEKEKFFPKSRHHKKSTQSKNSLLPTSSKLREFSRSVKQESYPTCFRRWVWVLRCRCPGRSCPHFDSVHHEHRHKRMILLLVLAAYVAACTRSAGSRQPRHAFARWS